MRRKIIMIIRSNEELIRAQENIISDTVNPDHPIAVTRALNPKNDSELDSLLRECEWVNDDKRSIIHSKMERPAHVYGMNKKLQLNSYAIHLIENG